jgi:hypothetical protein
MHILEGISPSSFHRDKIRAKVGQEKEIRDLYNDVFALLLFNGLITNEIK